MDETPVDYIIVGQGLAGSCMAFQLWRRNKTFLVFDQPSKNRCSVVAAGLFNPVTGQKLVKTWQWDHLFPYLRQFYRDVEKATGVDFFYSLPLYRPFGSVEEQNEWMGRSADDHYGPLIERVCSTGSFHGIKDPVGGLILRQCGYINSQLFIRVIRDLLKHSDKFREEFFEPANVQFDERSVRYGNISAKKIIFCEGTGVDKNPWFGKALIRSLKGETMRIKTSWEEQVIINRGVYMVPGFASGEWRVGATYDLKDKTDSITPRGRLELESKLRSLISFPFQITDQDFGFRPATVDRRPVLGTHPEYGQLVIFNGLGTKGVSLAPYFSEVLLQSIENARPLNKEVDVTRFKVLY